MTDEQPPLLRVVRGEATEEELAALVAVLAARSRTTSAGPSTRHGQWRSRGRNVRPVLSHGPGAWYASGLPR